MATICWSKAVTASYILMNQPAYNKQLKPSFLSYTIYHSNESPFINVPLWMRNAAYHWILGDT